MKIIRKIGIEVEFNFVLAFFLIAMLISQTILISFVEKNVSEQRRMSSEVISSQINTFLNIKLETLNRIKNEIRAEPAVRDILEESDHGKRGTLIKEYAEKMQEIQSYSPDVFYLVAKTADRAVENLSMDIADPEREMMKRIMDEDVYSSDSVSFFEVDGNAYSEYRYIFVDVPISRYDFSLYRSVDIGRIGICLKINMRDAFSSDRYKGQYENINLCLNMKGKEVNLINSQGNDSHLIYISGNYITNTDWEITGYVYDHTHSMLFFIRLLVYISIVMMVLLMLLFRIVITREIIKPISVIREYLTGHRLSNKTERLKIEGNRDISQLVESINKMYEQVRSDAKAIFRNQQVTYEKEILNVETQLRLLQNQVNPHFIYNTFETIRSIASFYNAKEICTIVSDMNKLLRYNLNGGSRVKVWDEIDIVSKYIEIMSIRFDDTFTFECECDEETKEESVLKMLCQPLIENCFSHGFKSDGSKLNIRMNIKAIDDKVVISISDDGKGISAQKRRELLKEMDAYSDGAGIGIRNLIYRLRLCYNNEFDFQILSEENAYTIINITVPKEIKSAVTNE